VIAGRPGRRRRAFRARHPLTAALRRLLGGERAEQARDYLALLDDRLAALAALADGGPLSRGDLRTSPADRAVARRFLASHEGAWDDGDENLVRGYLDRWLRKGDDPLAAAARGLSEAALALAGMRAGAETLWFFLWEMESVLAAVADNPGRPC
jgi:hypothetical protein